MSATARGNGPSSASPCRSSGSPSSCSGCPIGPPLWFVALGLAYGIASLAYLRFLERLDGGAAVLLYAFLLLDPIFLVGILFFDPETFAFLNPFLLVVIVRTGIRYGIRTMYLSWATTLVASLLLLASAFWRSNVELGLAYLVMVAVGPVCFSSLIRRVHAIRAIEEERAAALASRELAIARSAFLAKVSHELRSPLQGIVSALDVIEMRHARAFEGDEELIGRMRRSSMLLNTQLRDLLTLAKGEAGRLQIHAEPFEACALVEAMAEDARELAISKGLQLRVMLPPAPLFAVADGARIDQVLTNLVVNSIRYTDAGEVRVSMEPQGDPPNGLRFVVADTGPGIPEDVLPTLFEPDKFVTTPARRGEGSGIGLAIVRTLVDHLGGTLRVASELGKGTTFTVEIPAEFEAPDRADFADTDTHGRVLVVDDRSDVLDALESVIDELGYELDRAGSAAAATRLLSERTYDAVLLDLDMPIRGGAERGGGNAARRRTEPGVALHQHQRGRAVVDARSEFRRPAGQADRPVGAAPRAARRPPPGTAGPGGSLADGRLSDGSRRSEVNPAHHLLHRDRLG